MYIFFNIKIWMNSNKEGDSFEIQLTEGNVSSKSSTDNNIVIPLNEPEENLRHDNLNNMEIVVKLDNIKKLNHKKKTKHLRKDKDSKHHHNNDNDNNNDIDNDNDDEKKSVKKKLSHVEIRLKKIVDSAFDYNNSIVTKEDNYNIYRKFLQRKLIKNYERQKIVPTFLNIQFLPKENLFLNEKKNTNNTGKNVYKAIRTGPKANQEVHKNNNNIHRTINVNSNHKISNYNNLNNNNNKQNLNSQPNQNNNNSIKNNIITISSNGKSTVYEAKNNNNNINKPKVITVRSNAIINKVENHNNTLEIKEEIKNSSNIKTDLINLETLNKKDDEKINNEINNNVNNNENKEEEKPKKYKVITVRS